MTRPNAQITLFDALRLEYDGTPVEVRSEKIRALLVYLLLHRGRPLDRTALAEALWPEASESSARRNLREYLYRLRSLIADGWPFHLESDGDTVTFDPTDSVWVDVIAFEQLIERGQGAPLHQARHALTEAVSLYKGELVPALWEDWIFAERERLEALYAEALEALSDVHRRLGELPEAIAAAQRLLHLDPLQEGAHRRLMRLYYEAGDRARALQQYRECRSLLAEELAARPMPATRQLYQHMLDGTYQPAAPAAVNPPRAALAPHTERVGEAFVGRGEMLAALQEAYSDPDASLAVVSGVIGIGKTRLVSQWLSGLPPETLVLRGRSHEFERNIPYQPLLDALQQSLHLIPWETLPDAAAATWLAPLAQLLPDLYYYLPELSSADAVLEAEAGHYIQEGFAQLLLSFTRQVPVVLFLDDLHWADDSTWALLAFLQRRAQAVFIVATFSTSEANPEATARLRSLERAARPVVLHLGRLTPEEIAALARQKLGEAPETFTHRLDALTDGNPFFAAEILRAVEESGVHTSAAALDDLAIPPAVQLLVENRLDRLEPESQRALAVAAAFGREFSVDQLSAAAGVDEETLLDYFDVWLARGLVAEGATGCDFTHQQVRDVAYNRLSGPRRRRAHSRIAAVLAGQFGPQSEQATTHYQRGLNPVDAVPGLLAAGRRALNARAYEQARSTGQTLLDILEVSPLPEPLEHQLAQGLAYSFTGETQNALHMLEQALPLAASDEPHAVEVALRVAQLYWVRGSGPDARRYAEQAYAMIAGVEDSPFLLPVLRLLGRIAVSQGYFENAVSYLQRSLELDSNDMNRANTYGYLATAYGHLGAYDEATDAYTRALNLARRSESQALLAVAQVKAGITTNYLAEWELARTYTEAGIAACASLDLPVYVFVGRSILGRVLHYLGRSEEALAVLREAVQWATRNNYTLFRHLPHIFLAEVSLACGDEETVREQCAVVLRLAEETGNAWGRSRAGEMLAALG